MILKLLLASAASAALYTALSTFGALEPEGRPSARWVGEHPLEASPEFWLPWIALAVLYLASVRMVSRADRSGPTLWLIVLAGIVFRAIVVLGSGLDGTPRDAFLFAPSPLETIGRTLLPELVARRIVVAGIDSSAIVLVAALLKRAGLPSSLAIVHAWNPLSVLESAGHGRLELAAFVLLLWALERMSHGRLTIAALAFGASLSGPLLLAAAFPLMVRALRARVGISLAVAALAWHFGLGGKIGWALVSWPPPDSFGGSLAPAVSAMMELLVTRLPWAGIATALLLWGGIAFFRTWSTRLDEPRRVFHDALVLVGGLLFAAPTVLPWGFVAVSYLGAFTTNRGWLWFTLTAPVGYAVMATGGWSWSFWSGFAQYFVPYAVLIFWGLGSPPSK